MLDGLVHSLPVKDASNAPPFKLRREDGLHGEEESMRVGLVEEDMPSTPTRIDEEDILPLLLLFPLPTEPVSSHENELSSFGSSASSISSSDSNGSEGTTDLAIIQTGDLAKMSGVMGARRIWLLL